MKKKHLVFFMMLFILSGQAIFANKVNSVINTKKVEEIEIYGHQMKIVFIKGNKIYTEGRAQVKLRNGKLLIKHRKGISGVFKERTLIVKIGNNKKYKKISIDGAKIDISGNMKSNRLNIDGAAIVMRTNIEADKLAIDGTGIVYNGKIKGNYISIDGTGITMNLDLENVKRISIDGTAIKSRIKYLDSWIGRRIIAIDGVDGEVRLLIPEKNGKKKDGTLDVDVNGNIDVKVKRY